MILFLMFASIFSIGAEAITEKISAKEWLDLTRQRKIYFVLGSMEDFQQEKQVVFRHTMDDYIQWMDSKILKMSGQTDMNEIFSAIVAEKEKQ
jgi:hypothetical protein